MSFDANEIADFLERCAAEPASRLGQLQRYYIYDSEPLRFKKEPELNRDLVKAMKREGLDRDYRFTWGGVVIVREEPNGKKYQIARGSKDACEVLPNGMLLPRYLFRRCRQARGVYYFNDLNQRVAVLKPELVPPGKIALVDYRYVDFGVLKWHLETRASGQTLIEAGVYSAKDAPNEEWVCIGRLHSDELYYEPGLEMIDVLKKREWENKNQSLKDVAKQTMTALAKSRAEREVQEAEAEEKEFNQLYDDVERRTVNHPVAFDMHFQPVPDQFSKEIG